MMANTTTDNMIGIFGGTFDPPHLGHIEPVKEVASSLGLEQVSIIPCHIPPHKLQPGISNIHRIAMVELMIAHNPLFTIDDRELRKSSTSYSVETLEEIKHQQQDAKLCFFIGMDSLVNFETWYKWDKILNLCHLVVLARPGYNNQQLAKLNNQITARITNNADDLIHFDNGQILTTTNQAVDISSSYIRQQIKAKKSFRHLVPNYVADYILQHKLYQ